MPENGLSKVNMKRILFLSFLTLSMIASGQPAEKNETVVIRTEFGEIYVLIDLEKAPVTCNNFLKYVDAGLFDSTCFYRIVRMDNQPQNPVKIEVIQGGRYENEDKGFPPISHETTRATGLNHKDGTISMARNEPGTATSEFFICVGDQPELDFGGKRNPDGQGFAAFAKVIKGMDVVRRIHSLKAPSQYLEKPVLIVGISRVKEP